MKRYVVLALVTALAAGACGGDDDAGAGTRRATLVLNWTPNAHHLGIYAAEQLGWYDDAGIDLRIVEPTEGGAEQTVGTGDAAFGISIAEAVLPARAEGIPIVSIATILPVNDSALMALGESGIDGPSDLANATYGGYGGPLETELVNRLAECGGADPASIRHVEVGNVDYLAGLEAGRFDFVWIFAGWDGLRATEVEHEEVSLIPFADHLDCIPNWYTPLIITSEAMLRDDPDLVRAFLDVTTRGYEYAIDHPQRCADAMLRAVPEADETLLRAAADYHASRFRAGDAGWGTQDRETWVEFARFLVEAGLLDETGDVDAVYTNDYLPE